MIGITVNLWLGSMIMVATWVLLAIAFWLAARSAKRRRLIRISVAVLILLGLGLTGRQVLTQCHADHPINKPTVLHIPTAPEIVDEVSKRIPQQAQPAPKIGPQKVFLLPLQSEYRPSVRPNGWRKLEDWQQVTVTAAIATWPGQRVLLMVGPGEETRAYAADFQEAFLRAHWIVDGLKDTPEDQAVIGIQLSINEDYFGRENLVPKQYYALRSALGSIGAKYRSFFVMEPGVAKEQIVMWVGVRSPDWYKLDSNAPLEMSCQNPVHFSEEAIGPLPAYQTKYTRLISVDKPEGLHSNNNLRIYITEQAIAAGYIGIDGEVKITPAGKIMRRNDVLNIEPSSQVWRGEALRIMLTCDKPFRVKCIDDLGIRR